MFLVAFTLVIMRIWSCKRQWKQERENEKKAHARWLNEFAKSYRKLCIKFGSLCFSCKLRYSRECWCPPLQQVAGWITSARPSWAAMWRAEKLYFDVHVTAGFLKNLVKKGCQYIESVKKNTKGLFLYLSKSRRMMKIYPTSSLQEV